MTPTLAPPPPGWRPRAAVFDCDGVLMDTERAWARVQERVAQDYGVDFDRDSLRELMGLSARDVARWITGRAGTAAPATRDVPAPTLDEVYERLLDIEDTVVSGTLEPLPGAVEIVRALAEHMPVAVASNSTSRILDRKLRAVGLDDVLCTWVSSQDVAQGKPAPDIYREAARRLGVPAQECLAVEDSPAGTTAAVAAGMRVLGVPHGHDQPISSHFLAASLQSPEVGRLLDGWGL